MPELRKIKFNLGIHNHPSMRKLIITAIMLAVFLATIGQQTNQTTPALTRSDYLRKSKTQKTVAFVLLGAGATSIVIAATDNEKDSFGGAMTGSGWLLAGGVIASIVSIPLFVSSGKNKRKATGLSFKMDRMQRFDDRSLFDQPIPSLLLRIGL